MNGESGESTKGEDVLGAGTERLTASSQGSLQSGSRTCCRRREQSGTRDRNATSRTSRSTIRRSSSTTGFHSVSSAP